MCQLAVLRGSEDKACANSPLCCQGLFPEDTLCADGDSLSSDPSQIPHPQILVQALDPAATKMTVDKACANSPFCADRTPFELCCQGLDPEDTLCADGKHCCGEETAVTIGVSPEQRETACSKAAAKAE